METQVRPHYKSMARAMVAGGLDATELAGLFAMGVSAVSRILEDPSFQIEAKRLERGADDVAMEMRSALNAMAVGALEVLDEDLVMDPKDIKHRELRNRTARDVLDRAGYGASGVLPGSGDTILNYKTQTVVNKIDPKQLRDELLELTKLEPTGEGG